MLIYFLFFFALNALRYEDVIRDFSKIVEAKHTDPSEIYEVVCPHIPEFTWDCAPVSEIADCALRVLLENDAIDVKEENDASAVLMFVKVKNADAPCVNVKKYWNE